jgi:hypothetical protein
MNFSFKLFMESIVPIKPVGLKKSNKIRDRGLTIAKKYIEYKFKTKKGNVVSVQFTPDGNDSYEIRFYVNDTMDDSASKKDDDLRDAEILGGVLHIVKDKADKLNAKELHFSATNGKNDRKIIRGLDTESFKKEAIKEIDNFINLIKRHPVKMVAPNETMINILNKMGKPIPEPRPDLDVEKYVMLSDDMKKNLDYIFSLYGYIDKIGDSYSWEKFNIDIKPLQNALNNLIHAHLSNTSNGWERTENRRKKIYEKLVTQQMSDKWDVNLGSNSFRLKRK